MKFILLLCLLISSNIAIAKQWQIAIIDSQNSEPYTTIRKHFIDGLEQHGLIDEKQIKLKYHSIGNRKGTIKNIWRHFLKNKVDIIYVAGTVATIGALKYIDDPTIPIIFSAPTDPIGIGVIKSFDEFPTSQFTGVCFPVKVERRIDFIRDLFPEAKNFGMIYADMPQSRSYKKWLDKALTLPRNKGINFIYKKVQFIQSERGQERMGFLAKRQVKKIDHLVDIYLSPNDQLGTQSPFAKQVTQASKKPLIGIVKKDVTQDWGAVATISPSLKDIGHKTALMVAKIVNGVSVKKIKPQWPDVEIHISKKKVKELNIKVPEKYKKFIVN